MDTFNLDVDDFRAWLTAAGPYSIVGHSNDGSDCPIANYLKATHNTSDVHVGRFWVDIRDTEYNPAPLIKSFIIEVDGSQMDALYRPISAETAQAALDAALQEQANNETIQRDDRYRTSGARPYPVQ